MKHEDRALFDGLDLLRSVKKYRLGMPEEQFADCRKRFAGIGRKLR